MKNENGRVTTEKASACTDEILKKMKVDVLYPWSEWWKEFVEPFDEKPFLNFEVDRHAIKNLINEEFGARQKSNRLFVAFKKGVYMLNGDTAVAAKYFLGRVKKVASSVHTTIEKCHELSLADGLSADDSRMLSNASRTIDGNYTTLAGAIGRMRSIPKQVKLVALKTLGVDID